MFAVVNSGLLVAVLFHVHGIIVVADSGAIRVRPTTLTRLKLVRWTRRQIPQPVRNALPVVDRINGPRGYPGTGDGLSTFDVG